jgi:hypothetical protein
MNRERDIGYSFLLPGGFMQHDRSVHTARLRPLSGRDEEWLSLHRSSPAAVRVSWLLNSCLLTLGEREVSGELIRCLLVADRAYLVLQLRRLAIGDQVQAVTHCGACNKKMDVVFHLDDVPIECRPQRASAYSLKLQDREVRFRLPTGEDQEAILNIAEDEMAAELLNRCVLDDGGKPLSAEETVVVIMEMERRAPHLDLELDLICPECEGSFSLPFDTTAFFLEEMASRGDELLREVHALAYHYHWNETEILQLERSRRRAYLKLLNESLGRDWVN